MTQQGNTMTTKTYTVAGTSNCAGKTKARFANDFTARLKTLVRTGHTDIQLVQLPRAMSKTEACAYIYELPEFDTDTQREAIEDWVVNNGDTRAFVQQGQQEPRIVQTFQKEEFEPDF